VVSDQWAVVGEQAAREEECGRRSGAEKAVGVRREEGKVLNFAH
jgi:hypothetical protein